ncbi:IclR family transcriptional regulator [Sediminibacterium soli]|uniref:IclR family transcriptional regulator n=1 Tax=Sediminibacterium soli TaxID=2698829 RepID=UPI001379E18E|nr:IclR family transcriptional regulator C-terminal domain-containing protein [Sediminibacterium soli]NCI46918.1 helix-turn-helix domain-containing protein [Sediminibacterium soli]
MIQVIHRALDILEFVGSNNNTPKLLSEIARQLQLKPGTCANIVKTLTLRGYLDKLDSQKGYQLGRQVFSLTENSGYQQLLIDAADEVMAKTVAELHENVLLAILKNENRLVIHRKNSAQLVQANTPDEKKAYDSSTGRLLIAMLPDDQLERYVHEYGLPSASLWPHAHTKQRFLQQIQKIRNDGYALIEDSVQIVGIAAPVYRSGKVVASLSIYIPSFRVNAATRTKMIRLGTRAAKKISTALSVS